jgi:hypothetical protein
MLGLNILSIVGEKNKVTEELVRYHEGQEKVLLGKWAGFETNAFIRVTKKVLSIGERS